MSIQYLDKAGLTHYEGTVKTRLNNKVDKVSGKGLSTNDYTTAEKNKLAGIEAEAEVNVIESIKVNGVSATISGKEASVTIETGAIDTIKKNGVALPISDKTVDISVPVATSELTNDSNFVADASYVHTDNNYSTTDKNKLAGIAAGAQVNVLESVKVNGTALDISGKAVDVTVPTKTSDLTNDDNTVKDANYVHTDSNYTATEKTKLGTVAEGAQVNVIESVKVNGVAQTVTSKAVDIAVPTKTSDITNDSGFITKSVNNLENYTKSADLAAVATSNDYNDLDNLPEIPVVPTNVSAFTNDANYQNETQVNAAIAAAVASTYKAAGSVAFEIYQA